MEKQFVKYENFTHFWVVGSTNWFVIHESWTLNSYSGIIAEATKGFVPYFEVLQDGFVRRTWCWPSVFLINIRCKNLKTCENSNEKMPQKCL